MSLKNKSLLSFVSPSMRVRVPVPSDFSGPCTKHLSRVSSSESGPTNTSMTYSLSCSISLVQDLRPIFHWNTKQLFLYLSAEYNNTQGVCMHLPRFGLRLSRRRLSHSTCTRRYGSTTTLTPAFHFRLSTRL